MTYGLSMTSLKQIGKKLVENKEIGQIPTIYIRVVRVEVLFLAF